MMEAFTFILFVLTVIMLCMLVSIKQNNAFIIATVENRSNIAK